MVLYHAFPAALTLEASSYKEISNTESAHHFSIIDYRTRFQNYCKQNNHAPHNNWGDDMANGIQKYKNGMNLVGGCTVQLTPSAYPYVSINTYIISLEQNHCKPRKETYVHRHEQKHPQT